MEYFHPESKSLLHHPECSCCGKPHQDKIGGILAVYDTSKDPRSEIRNYFPYLHLACVVCYSKYESMFRARAILSYKFSAVPEFAGEICKNAPQWSMIWTIFDYKHRPFECIKASMDYSIFKSILSVSVKNTLPTNLLWKIYQFANFPNLTDFAYEVNGQADIEYWNENILESDWQEPSYDAIDVQ